MTDYKDLIDLILALFFLLTFIFIALFYFFSIKINIKFEAFDKKILDFNESIKKDFQFLHDKIDKETLYSINQSKNVQELTIKTYENLKIENESLYNLIIHLKNIELENSKNLNIIKRKVTNKSLNSNIKHNQNIMRDNVQL